MRMLYNKTIFNDFEYGFGKNKDDLFIYLSENKKFIHFSLLGIECFLSMNVFFITITMKCFP